MGAQVFGRKRSMESVLSCQLSVVSSQFSVLSSQFSVLSSQLSVIGFSVLGSRWSLKGRDGSRLKAEDWRLTTDD